MKTYTVYCKQDDDKHLQIEYIPESFSFLAFIFGIFWLVYNRLWAASSLFLMGMLLITQLEIAEVITSSISSIMLFGLSLLLGFMGNDLIRKRLEHQDYIFHDVIIASSENEAELKYIYQNYQEGTFDD